MATLKARSVAKAIVVFIVLAGALAYLRDPEWLSGLTHGFGPVEIGADGTRTRTMGGHGSFFVPANVQAVEFPIRMPFDTPSDWPVTATITLDDTPADRLVLSDDSWRMVRFRLPPRGSRKVRRVDIRVDRTRAGGRGPRVGELGVRR